MTRQRFIYGDDHIAHNVFFVPARRDRVAIHVHADGSVHVDAPQGEDLANIHRAVLKRARWIKRHVDAARRQREHIVPRN